MYYYNCFIFLRRFRFMIVNFVARPKRRMCELLNQWKKCKHCENVWSYVDIGKNIQDNMKNIAERTSPFIPMNWQYFPICECPVIHARIWNSIYCPSYTTLCARIQLRACQSYHTYVSNVVQRTVSYSWNKNHKQND